MLISDFYLQKKIQGGDIREFERLFVNYYKPLCHHADKIVKDMDAAEDIVQEFFYNFWKNRESISPRLSLNAYLYQSIRNNSLHYLEHLTVKETYTKQVLTDFQDILPESSPENIEIQDMNRIIQHTLNQMPERCSRIFKMNRFEGKKYREIAEILSVSVKTVEADMGKALHLFRKSLAEFTGENMKVSS
jgi:RNA polymerase sigma-70 factor, ECF subfamily